MNVNVRRCAKTLQSWTSTSGATANSIGLKLLGGKRRIWLRATTASDGIIATARGYPITSFNMEVIGYAAIADDNKC